MQTFLSWNLLYLFHAFWFCQVTGDKVEQNSSSQWIYPLLSIYTDAIDVNTDLYMFTLFDC